MTTPVLTSMLVRIPLLVLLLLAGCSVPLLDAGPPETADPMAPVTSASRPAPDAAPEASAVALDEVLPAELDGVELHTFAVGGAIIARLAERLAIGADELEVRYASEHGARFFQVYAVRAPGRSGPELVEAWADAAYAPELADVVVGEEQIGDRAVTVITSAQAANRLGTFRAYSIADTLVVVQAFDAEVATDVLSALP